MSLSSRRKYYSIAAFGLAALAIAITPVLPRIKKARREVQVINQTHFLTKCLETYVSDSGGFPESLEVMLAKQKIDNEILELGKGETIEYHRPKTNDPN